MNYREGWNLVIGAKKWHYFRDLRSLCGNWMRLKHPSGGYESAGEDSPDDCKACRRALEKEER